MAPIASATLPRVAAAAGATAALLQLSAVLYSRGLPYPAIHAALAPCAVGMWAALDSSLQVLIVSNRQLRLLTAVMSHLQDIIPTWLVKAAI